RAALLHVLGMAARAARSRGDATQALSGVPAQIIGDTLHLPGSDLDLTVQVELPVSATAPGVAVIPAKLATDIVRALEPGAVSVEIEEGEARISSGRSQFAV